MAKKQQVDYDRAFAKLGYSFRMNDMDDTVECNQRRVDDGIKAEIESKMIDLDFPASEIVRRYTGIANSNRYHPIKDYFNGLKWAGQDVFGQLMACLDFADRDFGEMIHWRFMHGVIGKVLNQDQNFMMVLDGEQGIGKSWYSTWLCPINDYFVEGVLNPDSKDTKVRIASRLLWEVGELQYTTRKTDVEALKNIITERWITVRPAFYRYDIVKPACCSFIGTINENGAGFLNDPTGSRRFAVAKINSIDWRGYSRLDKNQLWAQIYSSYQGGERGYLLPDEQRRQYEINGTYQLISSTHEMLLKFYEIDPIKYPLDWMPAADILLRLHENGMTGNQRAAQMEIAAIMEKMKVEKSSANAVTGHGRVVCYRGVKAI